MSNSLLVLRRSCAVEAGPLVIQTTTAVATNTSSFVCSALINANANVSQFADCWVYFTTAPVLGEQREVLRESGFDIDAGRVSLSRGLATTVSTSVGFEILSYVPAKTDDLGRVGWRECINEALRTNPPLNLLPVTGVTASGSYDITTIYSWLTQKSQILGIYFQDVGDDFPRPYRTSWDWLTDADAPRLLLPSEPFLTGQTFYVKARQPALYWIKTAGVWSADTDGLQSDSDEALPLLTQIRAEALAIAYRRTGDRERETFWSRKAFALRWWDAEEAEEDRVPKLQMVHRSSYGGGRSYR